MPPWARNSWALPNPHEKCSSIHRILHRRLSSDGRIPSFISQMLDSPAALFQLKSDAGNTLRIL